MLTRREFCTRTVALSGTLPFLTSHRTGESGYRQLHFQYLPVVPEQETASKLPVPDGHRVAFGYDYFSLNPSPDGTLLSLPGIPHNFRGDIYLRLHVAIDTREKDEVSVFLGDTHLKIGAMSIWYPTGLQIFETRLDVDPSALRNQGIRLRLQVGAKPLFLFASRQDNGSHLLLVPENTRESPHQWLNLLYSPRSLQPFDWLEGCVLDGLQELYVRKRDRNALKAIREHLDMYLVDDKNLVYVDLWARPKDNRFTNLESGIPFAIIARHRPSHPSVNLFLDFCKKRFDSERKLVSPHLTTEGCYTVAYPLAVLARELKDPGLYELALIETEERINFLAGSPDAVYRMGTKNQEKNDLNRNWSRGYVWFLLGLIRTAEELGNSPLKHDPRVIRLKDTYRHYAELALRYQQADHSWRAYLDLPETGYESSATAGFGAALAHGHRMGWLPGFSKKKLNYIYQRLQKSLTPDGFLKNVSQHNAGSMELMQKGAYRVISQYASGFMAHIKAHL